MKKVFYSILLFASLSGVFISCSSGDYNVNPTSGGVNPLDPLSISQFTWSGTSPLSADINGTLFVADSTLTTYSFDSGYNFIQGQKTTNSNTQELFLELSNVYAGNVYGMNFNNYTVYAVWVDSIGFSDSYYFSSLGNSGEVYITENDSAYIKGKFYFTGVTNNGRIAIVNNGYFSIKKP